MKDSFTKILYGILGAFVIGVIAYVLMMTFFACGFSQDCSQGQPAVARTPLAVPPPATLPEAQFTQDPTELFVVVDENETTLLTEVSCKIVAADFVDAWSAAGYPEGEPFTFVDIDGADCQATADDVKAVMVAAESMDTVIAVGEPAP